MVFDQQTGESVKLADFLVCDISPWDVERAQKNGISVDMLSYLAYFVFPFSGNDPLFSEENKDKLADLEKKYQEVVAKYDNDANAVLDKVTRTCEDTIIYCRMGLRKEMNGKECCDLNFNPGVYTTEGKCYNTAGKMDYNISKAVKPLGIMVAVHVGKDISDIINQKIASFLSYLNQGVTVVFSDPKDHPFISANKQSYYLLPNTINSVAVERAVIDSTGLRNSIFHKQECASSTDTEVIERRCPGYELYSKENCGLSTLRNVGVKILNCSLLFLPNPDNRPHCSPATTVKLFQLSQQKLEQPSEDSSCPLDCIKEIYSARVTSHAITQGFRTMVSKAILDTETQQAFTAITVHYPSFDTIKIVQHGKVRSMENRVY